jgi:hypothetical protein
MASIVLSELGTMMSSKGNRREGASQGPVSASGQSAEPLSSSML